MSNTWESNGQSYHNESGSWHLESNVERIHRGQVQLQHNAASVGFHGADTNLQRLSDSLIRQTFRHQTHYFLLSIR